MMTVMSLPNSEMTCLQAPQGEAGCPDRAATASATIHFSPSETAFATAFLSAHNDKP